LQKFLCNPCASIASIAVKFSFCKFQKATISRSKKKLQINIKILIQIYTLILITHFVREIASLSSEINLLFLSIFHNVAKVVYTF